LFGRDKQKGHNRKRGIDQKAEWLISHPVLPQKYDIRKYAAILPIVVSTFAHFIPSMAPKYWILYPGQRDKKWNERAVPRVLSMVEFLDLFISKKIRDMALRSPNLRRL
jgi:hypothetical protein